MFSSFGLWKFILCFILLFICFMSVSWHSLILEHDLVLRSVLMSWFIWHGFAQEYLYVICLYALWLVEIYFVFYFAFYLFFGCVMAFVNPWTWSCFKECPYVMVHSARVCTWVFIRIYTYTFVISKFTRLFGKMFRSFPSCTGCQASKYS